MNQKQISPNASPELSGIMRVPNPSAQERLEQREKALKKAQRAEKADKYLSRGTELLIGTGVVGLLAENAELAVGAGTAAVGVGAASSYARSRSIQHRAEMGEAQVARPPQQQAEVHKVPVTEV